MHTSPSAPLLQRILKGSVIVLLFTILSSPLGYLSRMVFARGMSMESYGLLYAMIGFFWIFVTFNDLGFGYSVTYLVPKLFREKNYQSCWNLFIYDLCIEVGSAIGISILLLLTSSFLGQYYFKVENIFPIMLVFCVYFIANGFVSAVNKFYTGLQDIFIYGSMEFVRLLCTFIPAVLIYLYWGNENVLWYAGTWAGAYVVVAILYSLPLLFKSEFKGVTVRWDFDLFAKMRSYALPTLLTSTIFSFISFTDIIFLTAFRGVADVGLYNVILPIVSMSIFLLAPISHFLLPLTSELIEESSQQVRSLLQAVVKFVPFIAMYFATFIALFPNASVSFLFGNKWGSQATIPLAIFAFGFVPNILAQYLGSVMAGLGKVSEKLKLSIIIGVISIGSNAVAAAVWGIMGIIFANSLIYVLSVLLYSRSLNKSVGLQLPLQKYFFTLCIFALLAFGISLFRFDPNTWIEFVSIGFVYTVIVGVVGIFFFSAERKLILSLIKSHWEMRTKTLPQTIHDEVL